jgi:GT2 family glycosyltransferase
MIDIIIPSLNSPLVDQIVLTILVQDQAELINRIVIVGKDDLGLLADLNNPVVYFIDTETAVSPATARNIGINQTTSDLLIFLDSDCMPQANWLAEHVAAHHAGHPVVGGGVLPDGENYWALAYNLTMFHEYFSTARPGARPFLPTLNLSVERNVIQSVGLLNETLPRSQDLDWTTRMNKSGFHPYFWPQTVVQHKHNRTTFYKVWKDCVRSGHFARQARLTHQCTLNTPFWLRSRAFVLLLSPLIATGVTGNILRKRPFIIKQYGQTIPAIYISKIAWCWGASQVKVPTG